ncbi:MAG: hypothetical protein ACKO0Z_01790 [Betaproteobacteria bacterium]
MRSSDPKRFQEEYLKWTEYACDYDWWDWAEEQLREKLKPDGVTVEKVFFRLAYSQGDYATFTGYLNLAEWMEARKDGPLTDDTPTFAEKYPALYLALQDYGDRVDITTNHRECHASVSIDNYGLSGNTYASGVFQHLDDEAWDELVDEQWGAAGLEQALQAYVDDISRQLYRDLRAEYEYLTSEESFIESCECNDVTFEIEECEV